MKKIYLFIIIIILLLISILFLFYFREESTNVNDNFSPAYKIYENKTFGFKFNYPNEYFINEKSKNSVSIGDEAGFWYILAYIKPYSKTLEEWISDNSDWEKVSELNIDNYKVLKLNNISSAEGSGLEYQLIFIKDKNLYRIMYRYLSEKEENRLINSIKIS